MVDTTILDKINLIYKFIMDNSLIGLVILLILFIVMDLLYGNNKKDTKRLYIVVIILAVVYILFSYYKPFLNIIDVYITNIFRLTYFPSIIEYMTMLLITIVIQVISIKKSNNNVLKNINIWIGILIESLFILNVIAMNKIHVDLNSITSIYENDLLLSIFQMTAIVFMIWLIINLFVSIICMFLSDKIELPKLSEDDGY